MPITAKTMLEMTTGALALAQARGESDLPEGYLDAIVRTHQRNRQLLTWEREGKVTLEYTKRYTSQKNTPEEFFHTIVHVNNGGPSFTDIPAEKAGAFPSEVLLANIALALLSKGEA